MRKPALLAVAISAIVLLCPFLPQASAQSVISARSGLVNYFEGVVFLDGQPLARKAGMFVRMNEGSTLLTESGRAEVLLTPDAYFRIGEESSLRMVSSAIDDTQVELLSGSAILDSGHAAEGSRIKVFFKDATVRIVKPGHYRIDAEPPQLRVFDGEAEVSRIGDAGPAKIEASQLMPLDGAPVVKRFTQGSDGLLDIWSEERGSLIASNMVNSQSISDPLLDSGPDVPADLASYIGYVPPLGVIAPGGGYSAVYSGYAPYPGVTLAAFAPLPAPSFLYIPRYRYTSIYSTRPTSVGSIGIGRIGGIGGLGIGSTPRPVYLPRPVTAPRAPVGIHPVGHR
jgi:hypothetical protein